VAGVLGVVQLVGELVRVPVADRSEELDVADQDVVPLPDQQGALVTLPEAVLRVLPPENRLRLDAEREELPRLAISAWASMKAARSRSRTG
jgi:hypothetical protein